MLLSMSNHYQTRAPRRQNGTGWTLTAQQCRESPKYDGIQFRHDNELRISHRIPDKRASNPRFRHQLGNSARQTLRLPESVPLRRLARNNIDRG